MPHKHEKTIIGLVLTVAIILAFSLLWSVVEWKEVLTSLIGSIVFALGAYSTARRWENITAEKRQLEREIEFDRECLLNWKMFLAQNDGFKKVGVPNHRQHPALRHLKYMYDHEMRPYQHQIIREQLPLDEIILLDPNNFPEETTKRNS